MKNKVILIITMLLVIVCTIIIYTLLFEEQNKLFYINVGIACLAEIILLANIPILSNEKLLTIKNVSLSVSLNLFAIVIFLWTAGCSLLMDQASNYYYILYYQWSNCNNGWWSYREKSIRHPKYYRK